MASSSDSESDSDIPAAAPRASPAPNPLPPSGGSAQLAASLPARPLAPMGKDDWLYLSDDYPEDGHTDVALRQMSIPPVAPATNGLPSIPGYELLTELGRGGMGVVYKAWQVKLQRLVALKMILAGAYASPEQMLRFLAEAETLAKLQHPHIVKIHEIGTHDKRPYFALEYIDGVKLGDLLGGVPQPPTAAAILIEKVARAIHFAHERGIIHRDIKPSNILLQIADFRRHGEGESEVSPISSSEICNLDYAIPKITDFGLAKHKTGGAGLTRSHEVLGTAPYMAPEQAQGNARDVGPAADIYSIGAILYEMLAGRPPFRAGNPMETMVQVMSLEPIPVSAIQAKTPRDLATICMKCLEKDPRKRYASAEALADDLRRFLQGEPIAARAAGPLERLAKWSRRRPATAALTASLVGALFLGAFSAAWGWRQAALARDEARRTEKDALHARDEARAVLRRSTREIERLQYALGRARLAAGDDAGYREICQSLLGQCHQNPGAEAVVEAARLATLRSNAVTDISQLLGAVECACHDQQNDPNLLESLGMVQYRAGNYPAAAARFRDLAETRKRAGLTIQPLLFWAMTEQQLGVTAQARQLLGQAIAQIEKAKGVSVTDAAIWRDLRREAEELINGK